jgi:hypothetical protein
VAEVFRTNGTKLSSFAMQLHDTGTGTSSRKTLAPPRDAPAKPPSENS